MQSTNRQIHTAIGDESSDNPDERSVRRVRRARAASRFKAGDVRCFLLANSNADLHPLLYREVCTASNDPGYPEEACDDAIQLGLIPCDGTTGSTANSHTDILSASATNWALPVVLVTDNVNATRRTPLPPNVVDVISNDSNGAARLCELQSRLGANVHQEIWLVGEHHAYTESLLTGLGYQVHTVDTLQQVDCADECSNLRTRAVTVVLNSSGPRSYGDFDKFPARLEQALSGNECFSLFVQLDAQSVEMKSLWQQRGATTVDTRYVSETEIIHKVQKTLQQQHRLAILKHDAVRDPISGICNNNYLEDCGRRLHAAAARGGSPFSVVVLQTRLNQSLGHTHNREVIDAIHQCLHDELRESDVIAQRFPEELVCLVTSTGHYAIAELVERLYARAKEVLVKQYRSECSLSIGATAEQGAEFDSMMHRATMAALQCQMPDNGPVVIL